MGQISSQVTENELAHAVNWYFSLNNILAANDRVVAAMDLMNLPKIYQRSQNQLHTASDGQKFEVRTDSLNANYSFKYFGKGQGVSAYTFIDERNLLWHSLVFSAAEREDDILRLITTIKLKETTASDIFRRLNSYSKQHALYNSYVAFRTFM